MNNRVVKADRPCDCLAIAVTGSVGAHSMPRRIKQLRQVFAGTVHVIMTKSATHFVTPTALRLFSGNPVMVDLFDEASPFPVPHINLSEQARLLLVMPASANILAKAAHGICDDLVSTTILSFNERVLFAPNMNEAMWRNPIVQENVQKLLSLGRVVFEPSPGLQVANGELGLGGMQSLEGIIDYLQELLPEAPWVPAGATSEGRQRSE